jgi:hypothetical protein
MMNSIGALPTELRRTLQVNTITFEYTLGALGEYVDAGLLVAMGHFAHQIGWPAAFRGFVDIQQKQLRHDPIDKLLTGFVSLVDGCGYTSDIDTALKPRPAHAKPEASDGKRTFNNAISKSTPKPAPGSIRPKLRH